MSITRRRAAIGGLSLLASTSISTIGWADWDSPLDGAVEGGEEFWLATDAYISGYPLVTMETTQRIMTNVALPKETAAPWASSLRLQHIRMLPFATDGAKRGHALHDRMD